MVGLVVRLPFLPTDAKLHNLSASKSSSPDQVVLPYSIPISEAGKLGIKKQWEQKKSHRHLFYYQIL